MRKEKKLVTELRTDLGDSIYLGELNGLDLDIQYMCMRSKNSEPTREELLEIERENIKPITDEELNTKDEWTQMNITLDVQINSEGMVRKVNLYGEEIVDPDEYEKELRRQEFRDNVTERKLLYEMKNKYYEMKNKLYEKKSRLYDDIPYEMRKSRYINFAERIKVLEDNIKVVEKDIRKVERLIKENKEEAE